MWDASGIHIDENHFAILRLGPPFWNCFSSALAAVRKLGRSTQEDLYMTDNEAVYSPREKGHFTRGGLGRMFPLNGALSRFNRLKLALGHCGYIYPSVGSLPRDAIYRARFALLWLHPSVIYLGDVSYLALPFTTKSCHKHAVDKTKTDPLEPTIWALFRPLASRAKCMIYKGFFAENHS